MTISLINFISNLFILTVISVESYGDRLNPGEELGDGYGINSPNGKYQAGLFQGFFFVANTVPGTNKWVKDSTPIYQSRFVSKGSRLVMQKDCNLVVYASSGNAVWSTRTAYDQLYDDCRTSFDQYCNRLYRSHIIYAKENGCTLWM